MLVCKYKPKFIPGDTRFKFFQIHIESGCSVIIIIRCNGRHIQTARECMYVTGTFYGNICKYIRILVFSMYIGDLEKGKPIEIGVGYMDPLSVSIC